ncbi:MAG: Arc family DNA binding domain-containing protein [Xanthomonadales bacterium]|nr:Arc family DNA binding domain-containing protein [Xanthomonadales bacterium]
MAAKKAFPLRIDENIWQAVRRWSDDELRSVNAQIEYLLRDALRKAGRMPAKDGRGQKAPGGQEG